MSNPLEIKILTYCHDCEKAFTDQHNNCPGCGSTSLLLCVPGPTIKGWIKSEQKLESAKQNQCGCCDYFIYGED